MKVFEYPDENKKKRRAADIESILIDMANYETLFGYSNEKVAEHWFSLKRDLSEALTKKKDEQGND